MFAQEDQISSNSLQSSGVVLNRRQSVATDHCLAQITTSPPLHLSLTLPSNLHLTRQLLSYIT